jgi:hypothetical protein
MAIHDYCHGCASHELPIKEDHIHQYINMRGSAATCWWIDGICYTTSSDAVDAVKDILKCNTGDALNMLSSLPRKVN